MSRQRAGYGLDASCEPRVLETVAAGSVTPLVGARPARPLPAASAIVCRAAVAGLAGLLAMWVFLAGAVEFVVIGDTRPEFESEDFRAFAELIPAINRLHPSCVVNLGDLIYGYGPPSKEKQWDKYQEVIRAFEVPYYQVPGNHDTHSREARRIYQRRFGGGYRSFDLGDCHFLLLDNCEEQRWGYLGPAQFEWLKADLERSQARSVFVFLHFPTWEPTRLDPRWHEFWAQQLHPLFKRCRVRAVFGGHFHAYGPTREFDGIRYFITGGGGAELIPEYKKAGGSHHFLRVKVDGDRYEVRVVTPHGEVSDVEADVMGGLAFADKYSSRIGFRLADQDLKAGVPFAVSVDNPYSEPLMGRAEWLVDASVFALQPAAASVHVPPAGTQTLSFSLKTLQPTAPLETMPRLEFDVRAGRQRHRFHREVLFLEAIETAYRRQPPVLDGRLGEWTSLKGLDPGRGGQPQASVAAVHDGESLFLAIRIPAASAEEKSEMAFPDDLQVGFARRLNDSSFSGDFLRCGLSAALSHARNRTAAANAGAVLPGVRSAAREEKGVVTFELAVPFRFLKVPRLGEPGGLVLNICYPRPEPTEGEFAAPPPNSFAYQVRYGADNLVPIHFFELELKGKH